MAERGTGRRNGLSFIRHLRFLFSWLMQEPDHGAGMVQALLNTAWELRRRQDGKERRGKGESWSDH